MKKVLLDVCYDRNSLLVIGYVNIKTIDGLINLRYLTYSVANPFTQICRSGQQQWKHKGGVAKVGELVPPSVDQRQGEPSPLMPELRAPPISRISNAI